MQNILKMAMLGVLAFGVMSSTIHAQPFPTKPVRIITPFPAGSGPEVSVRLVAEKCYFR